MPGAGPEPYRRAIELAAAVGQVGREVASAALDRLRRQPEGALDDAVVASWLGVSESALRSLEALAAEATALEEVPVPTLRVGLAAGTVDTLAAGAGHPPAGLLEDPGPTKLGAPLPLIPGFEVDSLIGRGGMGSVYRARQPELRREVALKVLRPPDPRAAERFLREARAAASVQHPHVVTCYGAGRADELLYIALELVPGGDAERLIREHGRLPERRALAIARDACRGLVAIEAQGLVHRDLKPANLLLDAEGHAKIADLGLARCYAGDDRLTNTGAFVGTPAYMAPEQACAEDVDVRADIYGLGATLFHLVTGAPPFAGHVLAILSEKASGRVPDPAALRPELGAATRAVVRKAMAHAPGDRHPSASALLADLERALEARTDSVRSRSSRIRAASRSARWRARLSTPGAAAAGGAALIAAIAIVLAALRPWQGAEPAASTGPTADRAAEGRPPDIAAGEPGPPGIPTALGASPAISPGTEGAGTAAAADPEPATGAPRPELASAAPDAEARPSPEPRRTQALLLSRQLGVSAPARLRTAGRKVHQEGTWYTIVTESPAWSAASLFGVDARSVPVRADFHVQPGVSRDATALERAEQGFEARGGFFYELGVRSEPHEIASAGELHGFAVWVTLVCDKEDKAHGLIRVVNGAKPADDHTLRVLGDAPTPGVAIVDRFEIPQVSHWGATEVWLRVESAQLNVAVVRRGRKLYELARSWGDLPLAVGDGPSRPLYLWAQMGNWGNGRGHGSMQVEVEAD